MLAFIIFRDRVTYARRCMSSLMAAGLEPVIVDHGSTWPAAVAWLEHLDSSGVTVLRYGGGHPRDLWNRVEFRQLCGADRYVTTDPDVIPSEDCPRDWPQRLSAVLDEHPSYHKAGLGLRLDRIPVHYERRDQVIGWEDQFWQRQLTGGVYHADIDTTLAMCVPLTEQGSHSFSAVRTGPPYVADHVAWYEDFGNLTDEQRFYHEHAEPDISFWTLRGRSAWGGNG